MLARIKTIICGGGQIGQALAEVLAGYEPKIIDVVPERSRSVLTEGEVCDVLLIAFPWSTGFIEAVRGYQERFKPQVTVIHSTVEEGTSRKLGAVFSPIVGIHPFLVEGIRRGTRFLAGTDASLVADFYRRAGLRVSLSDNQDEIEYSKLRQTKFYALQNAFVKDTARDCRKKNFSFATAYTLPSADYNRQYAEQGMPYHLPLLAPILLPFGGHCLRPNLDLQPDKWSDIIRECDDENKEGT